MSNTLGKPTQLTGDEKRALLARLLRERNGASESRSKEGFAHRLFEAWAARSPSAVAIEFEGHVLTYEALNVRANRLANYLRRLGVGPETLVGICLERSLDMVVALLGVLK